MKHIVGSVVHLLSTSGFCLISLGIDRLPEPITTSSWSKHVIGYHGYIKSIRHDVRGKMCSSFMLGMETTRSRLVLVGNLGVCSGDVGFYSISNLLIHQYTTSMKDHRLSLFPNISTFQYFNSILGSTLSSNTTVISLSKFQSWPRLKAFVIGVITNNSSCFIFNPKSQTRNRMLVYILNYNNFVGSNLPLTIGLNLGLSSEDILISTTSRVTLSSMNMTSLVLISSCSNITLIGNNILVFSNN